MKLKRRRIKRGRVEVIPLIDTIVILLVFYMSFSRVAQMQKEEVDLPEAQSGEDIKEELNKVFVNMYSADNIRIEGNTYKVAELTQLLRQRKVDNPKISITLRGAKNATYKDLSEVMTAFTKAGIADVTFATYEVR